LKTATDCELMMLSRENFEKILEKEFPHIFSKLKNLATKRSESLEISKK